MFMTNNITKFALALALSFTSIISGCGGDDSSDQPFCKDGTCGDGGSGGSGGSGSDPCGGYCTSGTTCNVSTKKCESSGTDACGNTCGGNTHCNTSTKKCEANGTNDGCNNSCGPGTSCIGGKCVDGSGGSGGSGGGTTGAFASVTWKNSNSPSGNGWVDVSSGSDGDYLLGKTASFVKSETGAAVCFIGYGSGTILTLIGAGDWWNPSKSWLGGQVGKNPDDLSYMTSKQASIDSASRLITYRNTSVNSRPANAFYWRAGGSNNSWIDPEAVGSNQSAIHCTFVPNSGVAEVYSYSMSTGTGSGTGLNPQSLGFNAPMFVSPFEFIDTNTGHFVARSRFEKMIFDIEFPAEIQKLPIEDIYTAE